MKHTSHRLSYLLAFLPAVIIAGILGSVLQTQFNILAIGAIGPAIDLQTRFDTTWYDLLHFGPLFTAMVVVAFIVALPAAHLIVRIQRRQFIAWCAVAGAVSLWATFLIANHFAPMPTLIAATRTTVGTLFMTSSGLVGGFVYAVLSRHFRKRLIRKLRAQHHQRIQGNVTSAKATTTDSERTSCKH